MIHHCAQCISVDETNFERLDKCNFFLDNNSMQMPKIKIKPNYSRYDCNQRIKNNSS